MLSDGVKKWSILLPTYPLPATWRVAVRREYLGRLELAKARRADLIIIGHPKSRICSGFLKVSKKFLQSENYHFKQKKEAMSLL